VTVHLVGAGPGDPGLITARGLELIRRCEALVYDRLVARELVDEAPTGAIRISRESLSQQEIDRLLVALAQRGLEVVRLKGGDPFVFGRGGEEALVLARAGIPFEIVPGVSSLAAVPAAAGIPITHRGLASQVTAVAGHDDAALDYEWLARSRGTIVVFMGLDRLDAIVAGLVAAGLDAATPAAVIANGTTVEQRVAVAPLAAIVRAAHELESPALLVVGDVVHVRSLLAEAVAQELLSA
jgi:uroporphyrin-III C-methyltransferase